MIPTRDDEPDYAILDDKTTQDENRYGQPIQFLPDGDKGLSLRINGDAGIGDNPNRTKQHAFHFTTDNCIGCHACESACSEKNDLPPHLSFRSVGYVEGGTYPDYQRLNISMACNHCDDPVCLKGCPTRAYTKHPEYGAVIQDPDICFGCGYCTWVCPYNAPQLDPVNGQVEKCNMCVDRLEVGLKPACVSACVGNALDFGVVENTPKNREQIETRIPGFPDPSITQPNIRFQQLKSSPLEMTRTDSMPLKYHKDDQSGHYKPVIDPKNGQHKSWNLRRLSSRENPLVIFTLSTQAAIGAVLIPFLGYLAGVASLQSVVNSDVYIVLLIAAFALVNLGLLMSTLHLGKPIRFYRGFNNLRHSPVSREGLGIVIFTGFLALHGLCKLPDNSLIQHLLGFELTAQLSFLKTPADVFGIITIVAGMVALYYMYQCYRIKARPFWNHWQAAATFYGNMLVLGALLIGVMYVPVILFNGMNPADLLKTLAIPMLIGIALESIGLWCHARDMRSAEHEGAVSHYIQTTTFGKTYYLRNILMVVNLVSIASMVMVSNVNAWLLTSWAALSLSLVAAALIGRALFYILVVPTTMPGAFFWKNKAFEQHAKDIGLANNPSVGVAPDHH
ncbi:MAG: dimethyl sulfoxide reductase anchor subunit [Gammaproteobacteria bacterium]|nr:dimethyl sulfoxide reductase anchor subunit [Gammaproteobacteria bacterium]